MTKPRPTIPLRAALTAALCLAPLVAGAAGTPDQSCRAAKLKAAGKYAAALAGCHSKSATDNSTPDPECLSKAAGKIADAFSKADAKEEACNGLDSTSSADVLNLVDAILDAAPTSTGGKCPSSIYKAGGKAASSDLGAWSKFVAGGDAGKRDEALAKTAIKLDEAVIKAEAKDGCMGTGQSAAVALAITNGIEPLLDCLAGTGSCTEAAVGAGQTVTTDPEGTGPDAEDPITASLQTPVEGEVSLRVVDPGVTPPAGYTILGQEIEITAPTASAGSPLVLTFRVDSSLLPPDPFTVQIARNGVLIADCSGPVGTASPDPCVKSRTLVSGDLEIVTLSSHASSYDILVQSGPTTTVTTTTTTTTLPLPADYWMRWQVNADKVGSDKASELDIGWAGGTHDIDPVDGSGIRFGLNCPSANLPTSYGECTVTGFDPAENNCRCSNNTATTCDEPQVADADDCGGATCNCYTRPPIPAVVSGTSICLLGAASSDASGTWNPDTGSGDVTLNETIRLYLGIATEQPCPVCVGDATANDGTKGGTCSGGQTPGAACDANGSDPTYPIPGGGSTSLDCLPANANNITGPGMRFPHVESTSSASLSSSIPCPGSPMESCQCAACSADGSYGCSSDAECLARLGTRCSVDQAESCSNNADCAAVNEGTCNQTFHYCSGAIGSVACTTNADCAAVNVGPCISPTCSVVGSAGTAGQPNGCYTTCDAGLDGEATCDGPIDARCDGFVEEDGKGIVACADNSDCAYYGPSAGNCTLGSPRACFLPTITATGVASPTSPRTVAALCVGPTANASANTVSGLPGPARLRTDWTVTYGSN